MESNALRRPSFSSSSSLSLASICLLSFLFSEADFSFCFLSLSLALARSSARVSSKASHLRRPSLSLVSSVLTSLSRRATAAWDLLLISWYSNTSVERHSLVAKFSASLAWSSSVCWAASSICFWQVWMACLYWPSASSRFSSVRSRAFLTSLCSLFSFISRSIAMESTWTLTSEMFHAERSVFQAKFWSVFPTSLQVSQPWKL
mmetsp:Transcript_1060/g.3129  ORF Transcript_1060/g.3129 Transcript_1060/m.3129 type:complete len:204 (-) Transcript_1060:500-1111(-)